MPENKILTWIAEFVAAFLVVAILVALFLAILPGCRTVHAEKQTSHLQLDSSRQVLDLSKAGTRQDSSVHLFKVDSQAGKSRLNYERTTTIQERLDTSTGKPVKLRTRIIQERGTSIDEQTQVNTEGLNIDWSKIDTSAHAIKVQDQVKKTETTTSKERQVRSLAWWVIPALIAASLGLLYIVGNPAAIWSWILALFRRKKQQDKA